MAAHLRDIHVHKCEWLGCDKRATVQLFNTRNAPLGEYCKPHGNKALKAHKQRVGEA